MAARLAELLKVDRAVFVSVKDAVEAVRTVSYLD